MVTITGGELFNGGEQTGRCDGRPGLGSTRSGVWVVLPDVRANARLRLVREGTADETDERLLPSAN